MGEMKAQCLLYRKRYHALHSGRKALIGWISSSFALIGQHILSSDWLYLEPLALDNPTRSIALIILFYFILFYFILFYIFYYIILYFNIFWTRKKNERRRIVNGLEKPKWSRRWDSSPQPSDHVSSAVGKMTSLLWDCCAGGGYSGVLRGFAHSFRRILNPFFSL